MRFLLLLASPERGSSGGSSGVAVVAAVAAVALADVFVELTAGAMISHLVGGWRGWGGLDVGSERKKTYHLVI